MKRSEFYNAILNSEFLSVHQAMTYINKFTQEFDAELTRQPSLKELTAMHVAMIDGIVFDRDNCLEDHYEDYNDAEVQAYINDTWRTAILDHLVNNIAFCDKDPCIKLPENEMIL